MARGGQGLDGDGERTHGMGREWERMAGRPCDPPGAGKRELILAAALKAFTERGYAQATVKDIADRAGVAAGTFYLYFTAKEEVGLALIDTMFERVMASARANRQGFSDPREKLLASARGVLEAFGTDAPLSRFVLVSAPGAHPAFDERLSEVHAALIALVAEDVAETLGPAFAQATERVAEALVGGVGEVITAWVRSGGRPRDLARSAETLAAFFGAGLEGVRQHV